MKKSLLLGLAITMALPGIQVYGMEAPETQEDRDLARAIQNSLTDANQEENHNNRYNKFVVNRKVTVGGRTVDPITLNGIPTEGDEQVAFQAAAQQEPKEKFYSRPFSWSNFFWNHKKAILAICFTAGILGYWYYKNIKK